MHGRDSNWRFITGKMKIVRIVILLIAILVLNVIFADRYLIPTKTIPADQIIYSDESPKTKNEFVLLNSQVYLDETNSIESNALTTIGKYKVATTTERFLPLLISLSFVCFILNSPFVLGAIISRSSLLPLKYFII